MYEHTLLNPFVYSSLSVVVLTLFHFRTKNNTNHQPNIQPSSDSIVKIYLFKVLNVVVHSPYSVVNFKLINFEDDLLLN